MSLLKRKPAYVLIGVMSLLALVRIGAPSALAGYANSVLQQEPGIVGRVADIDLSVWQGRYDIHNLRIYQLSQGDALPLFSAKRIRIQLSWYALLQGKAVVTLSFHDPVIMAIDDTDQEDITQEAVLDERTWIDFANRLSIFPIDHIQLHNGSVEFNAIAEDVLGELVVMDVSGTISNLHHESSSLRHSKVDLTGLVGATAPVCLYGKFNPHTEKSDFDISLHMGKLPADATDNIVTIYAPFDVEAGHLELAARLTSRAGQVEGFVTAGIYQLDVFSWKDDVLTDIVNGSENPLGLFVEAFSALLATLLENRSNQLIATRIPLNGQLNDPDTSWLKAFAGLLRNAFTQAYHLDADTLLKGAMAQPEQTRCSPVRGHQHAE